MADYPLPYTGAQVSEAIGDARTISAVSTGKIPIKTASGFADSFMEQKQVNGQERVVTDKPLQTTARSLHLGENVTLTDAGGWAGIRLESTGEEGIMPVFMVEQTGSTHPFWYKVGPTEGLVLQPVGDKTQADPTFTWVATGDRRVKTLTIDVTVGGTGGIVIRHENSSGVVLARADNVTWSVGKNHVTFEPPVIFTLNENLYIEITGCTVKGSDSTGTFIPEMDITKQDWVKDYITSLVQATVSGSTVTLTMDTGTQVTFDLPANDLVGAAAKDAETITFTRRDGTTFDVQLSTVQPVIDTFGIRGQSTLVQEGTLISGIKTFDYHVTNPSAITGNLTLFQDGVSLITTIPPGGSTFDNGVNSKTLTNAGDKTTFVLHGVGPGGSFIEKTFEIVAATAQLLAYWGLSSSNNPATVDYTNMQHSAAGAGDTSTSTGTTSAGDYFIILVPSQHDITKIVDTVLQQDVTDIFTKTADVRQIGGVNYNSYVLGPLNPGADEGYTITTS